MTRVYTCGLRNHFRVYTCGFRDHFRVYTCGFDISYYTLPNVIIYTPPPPGNDF